MANFTSLYNVCKPVEVVTQGSKEMKFVPEDTTFDLDLVEYCTPFWNSISGQWDRTKTQVYMHSGSSFLLDFNFSQFSSIL